MGADVKQPNEWSQLDLAGDPILIVGRRPKPKALEAFVVDLHQETFQTMRGIANETTNVLADSVRQDWHPDASLEPGEEYLTIQVDALPAPPPARRPRRRSSLASQESNDLDVPTNIQLAEAAALIRLVLAPGELDNLDPNELAGGNFRFYAIVWQAGDGGRPVAFVSEYDPTNVLRKASSWFRFDGTLRGADRPDFTLDDRADLVITTDEIAMLTTTAFDHLFSDVRALLNEVPANVAALRKALRNLPMTDASRQALEQVCATRPSLARRLQNLASSPGAGSINSTTLRAVLRKHEQDPNDFITRGTLDIGPAQVGVLLDVAEGRWYEADFTSEPRRAARWSRR